MSTTSKLTLLAGAAALLGWLAVELRDTRPLAPAAGLRVGQDEAQLAPRPAQPEAGLLERGRREQAGDRNLDTGTTVAARPLARQVVNRANGAPLPAFELSLTVDGHSQTVWTDAEGRYRSQEPILAGSASLIDHHELPRRQPERVDFTVSDEPLVFEAGVGPTLRLDIELPPGTSAEDFRMELRCARPSQGSVYVADAPMREPLTDLPWVRFGPWAWALPGDAPWELHAIGREGLDRGETEIAALTEDRAEPVTIELRAFGRAVVDLDDPAGEVLFQDAELDLYDHSGNSEPGRTWRGGPALFDGVWRGTPALAPQAFVADFLEPGLYRATLERPRYQPAECVFSVELGRTTRTTLTLTRRPGLASVAGTLRTRSGGAPPGEIHFVLEDPEHPYQGYAAELERVASDPPGVYRFLFPDVPAKRYPLRPIHTDKRLRFEPERLSVTAGERGLEFVCVDDLAPQERMRFEVRSEETGDPVPHARLEWFDGDPALAPHRQRAFFEADGSVERPRPAGAFQWVVRASRHRAVFGDQSQLVAGPDGSSLARVVLEPGWGDVLRVRGPAGAVAGMAIFVDGLEAGLTDDEGELRLAGEAQPRTVELVSKAWRISGGDVDPTTGALRSKDWGIEVSVEPID